MRFFEIVSSMFCYFKNKRYNKCCNFITIITIYFDCCQNQLLPNWINFLIKIKNRLINFYLLFLCIT